MKESDIRDRNTHARYLELVRQDAELLASDASAFEPIRCPVCDGSHEGASFQKLGFRYVTCMGCETLYVSPRPRYSALEIMYRESASTKYWVEEFFKPVAEARREKIFRPRARFIAEQFNSLSSARVGDIGAGFGLFLEELRTLWPQAELVAIEPSEEMAEICRSKGLIVLQHMLEELPPDEPPFDLLTAFELFEHLHDPLSFLKRVRELLRPGGLFAMTTLSGLGFDVQTLWEHSRSVSPPHHLNFSNPFTIGLLMQRAGFEIVDIATPGELDWDILERSLPEEADSNHRFWRTVSRHATPDAKAALQAWVGTNGFSSHMRVVARVK